MSEENGYFDADSLLKSIHSEIHDEKKETLWQNVLKYSLESLLLFHEDDHLFGKWKAADVDEVAGAPVECLSQETIDYPMNWALMNSVMNSV